MAELTNRQKSRRQALQALAAAAAGVSLNSSLVGQAVGQAPTPPIPVQAINHITLAVSDPAASVQWYQGLFGLPIAARQNETTVLRVGEGPQFIAIGGNPSDTPRITHYCLAVDGFDHERIVQTLTEHGVAATGQSEALQSRVRMRGPEFGGAEGGTPELYFRDINGIEVQIQDSAYCGGSGLLGEVCLETPEPAPTDGHIRLREFNHLTLFVESQLESVGFYRRLFGLNIDTYQGGMPILRVGALREFLALAQVPPLAGRIHHASLNVDDFDVDRIFSILEDYGLTILGESGSANGPLQAYVTMRMPDRGGAPGGTPEVYFTDPDGILLQLQDQRYCGGAGYFGEECGTVENPTGRNV
ncbi:MAG: VOC family protein [Pseudomonadales bacterium]|nr:VOC family protein [Pseudomonadales bacterium]